MARQMKIRKRFRQFSDARKERQMDRKKWKIKKLADILSKRKPDRLLDQMVAYPLGIAWTISLGAAVVVGFVLGERLPAYTNQTEETLAYLLVMAVVAGVFFFSPGGPPS